MDVPLEILDREVARAAAAISATRARLDRGEGSADDNPLEQHRRVSSRATFIALAPERAPLAAPLRAWLYALTLDRVLWPDAVRLASARSEETVPLELQGAPPSLSSPRGLVTWILRERDDARRRIVANALVDGSVAVSDAARIIADRRREAARQLEADPDAYEIPCDPHDALGPIAERLLVETAPFMEQDRKWSSALASSAGRSSGEGWPARLTPRWIEEMFRPTGLTDGLRIDLGPLPEPIGAASFARALASFGTALGAADGPGGFFTLAQSPFDLRRARRAALFGALAADPVFAFRALGLGRGRARDQARDVARALLVGVRLDAARVLLRGALSLPDRNGASRFEEVSALALGTPIPPALLGVVPRLGPGDAAGFAGELLAARDRRALIERFDEDWFRNPHAAHAIREEDASPVLHRAPAAALEAGLAEIVATLGALA